MYGKRKRKIAGVVIVCCLGTGLFSGCTERTKDYDLEEAYGEGESKEGASSGLLQFQGAENWQETVMTALQDGQTLTIVIDTEVTVPEAEGMAVIEVEEPQLDAAYKELVISAVFGDLPVYYKDEEHWTRQELEEVIAGYEKLQEEGAGSYAEQIAECREQIAAYGRQAEAAPEEDVLASDYESDQYLAYRNGIPYCVNFISETVWEGTFGMKSINLFPADQSLVCSKQFRERLLYDDDVMKLECAEAAGGANLCVYTEDEAQKLAAQLLAELGFPLLTCTETEPLVEVLYPHGSEADREISSDYYGYEFRFVLGELYGEADSFIYKDFGEMLLNGETDYFYSTDMSVTAYVTDEGVCLLEIQNPVGIVSVTADVKLISLKNIKDILRNAFVEEPDSFGFSTAEETTLSFNAMELIHLRIRDGEKENYYSYVPVWRLSYRYSDNNGEIRIRNPVFINAIDGSVIKASDWM